MLYRRAFVLLLVVLAALSSIAFVPLVMAQTDPSLEVTEVVDLPESGQLFVIQTDELEDGGIVVVPVEDEQSPIREYLYLAVIVALIVVMAYDRNRVLGTITNYIDQAYESLPISFGDMLKEGIENGIQVGRDLVATTPGTLDDEAFERWASEFSEKVVSKLERDGRLPYPTESLEAFQARRQVDKG